MTAELPTTKPPFVIGIAGGSASGKSTLAGAIKADLQHLTVELFSMDRYAVADKSTGPSFVFSQTGESMFNWNHPDSFDHARLVADVAAWAWADDALNVIIVEGLMVLHEPTVREMLDLSIFVDLEADIRALRRLLRDMSGGRANSDPKFIADYYLECARIGHGLYVEPSRVHADFVVRGDADFVRTARLIAAIVRSH